MAETTLNYPIILFVFNRLNHLKKVVAALEKNKLFKESNLYIYSDNAKETKDIKKVEEVRSYIKKLDHPYKHITLRKKNYGINKNFMEGISECLLKFPGVIIIDDDTIVSPFFLDFMNKGLRKYQDKKNVGAICGYAHSFLKNIKEDTYFMYRGASWGWAVWKRSWDGFKYQSDEYWRRINHSKLVDIVTYNKHLFWFKDQMHIFDNQFLMYMTLNNMLTLSPSRSLVETIGSDGTGINTPETKKYNTCIATKPIILNDIPIKDNLKIRKKYNRYHLKYHLKHVFIVVIKFLLIFGKNKVYLLFNLFSKRLRN